METGTRVRPRDAATLVLVREDADAPRLLMGQRSDGHVFMPGKFVFPGGRLDRADHRIRPTHTLRPEVLSRLTHGCSPARAQALALAAVRETFEETGLLVGERVARPARSRSPIWSRYLAAGVAPTLADFDFIARAITPPGSPRRFDARFFMASADLIQGDLHEDLAGDGELLDLHWVRVDAAQALDLPEVTHMVIDEVAKRLALPPAERPRMRTPFYQFRGNRFSVDLL